MDEDSAAKLAEIGEVVPTAISTGELLESGILKLVVRPNLWVTEELALAERLAIKRHFGNTRRLTLVDVTRSAGLDRAAADIFANDFELLRAISIVSESLLGSMSANLFMALVPPKLPTKLFRDEQAALKWLLELPVLATKQNGEQTGT